MVLSSKKSDIPIMGGHPEAADERGTVLRGRQGWIGQKRMALVGSWV